MNPDYTGRFNFVSKNGHYSLEVTPASIDHKEFLFCIGEDSSKRYITIPTEVVEDLANWLDRVLEIIKREGD